MNNNLGLRASDLAAICDILKKHPAVEQAYVFGSRAKGNYKPGSDVDLALKGDQIKLRTTSDISFELNEETNMPYNFDVLDYNTISEPSLRDHIDRIGVLIFRKSTFGNEIGKVLTTKS